MALPAITSVSVIEDIDEQLRPITFDEYRALPDSNLRRELIGGEIVESSPARTVHQRVLLRLALVLHKHAEERECGEVLVAPLDVKLSEYTAVTPDIIYVGVESKDMIGEDFIDGAPDLLIEVMSPESRRVDLVLKRAIFADHRVREYWIVDPAKQTISINSLQDECYLESIIENGALSSSVLPELTVDVPKLFEIPRWMMKSANVNEERSNNGN